MKRFCQLAVCSFVALAMLGGSSVTAQKDKKTRVLFVVAGHDGEKKAPILDKLFQQLDLFEVTRLNEKDLPKLAQVKQGEYDVLLFYGGPQTKEDQERAIENFVDEGGGVVALHH